MTVNIKFQLIGSGSFPTLPEHFRDATKDAPFDHYTTYPNFSVRAAGGCYGDGDGDGDGDGEGINYYGHISSGERLTEESVRGDVEKIAEFFGKKLRNLEVGPNH